MRLGKKREAFEIDFSFSTSPISPPAALIFQFRLAILIQSAKEFKLLLARISEEIRFVDGRNAGVGMMIYLARLHSASDCIAGRELIEAGFVDGGFGFYRSENVYN